MTYQSRVNKCLCKKTSQPIGVSVGRPHIMLYLVRIDVAITKMIHLLLHVVVRIRAGMFQPKPCEGLFKSFRIGLFTIFDAILKGWQIGQKLQCLYGNTTGDNFFKN